MSRRGFAPIILVIVAAILAVGIGEYLWLAKKAAKTPNAPAAQQAPSSTQAIPSPAPSPSTTPASSSTIDTSNWTIYHNARYGYFFKYPPDWSLSSTDWSQDLLRTTGSQGSSSANLDDGMQLSINDGSPLFASEAGFVKSARQTLWGTCLGGGPFEHSYTMEVVSESTSTNYNGVLYYKGYFKVIEDGDDIGTNGPLYAFDIPYPGSDGSDRILTVIPGKINAKINLYACEAASSSRPESPIVHAFVENISVR